MANDQLSKMFLMGANNSTIYMPATPEYDFFIGIPERQKKLIKLAKTQISVQYEIAKSNKSSNSIIAQEIEQFSAKLSRDVTDVSANMAQVSDNISQVSENILRTGARTVSAIESLEYSLICEFREVRWLLSQIGEKLDEIMYILKNKRKFEANELLEQAISNLKNGYYQEAKERLIKALEFDNTDYQIHRNLGFVFLHENNADKSIEYFQKAVAFSPNTKMKINSIADLSRAFYAIDNYAKALEYQNKLLEIINHNRHIINVYESARIIYNHAIYSCLTGDLNTSLKSLDRAITLRSIYFVLATIDQDFKNIRVHMDNFLGEKVKLALQESGLSLKSLLILRAELKKILTNFNSSNLNEVDKNLNIAKLKFENASYTDLLDIKLIAPVLSNILMLIKNKHEIYEKLKSEEQYLRKETKRLVAFENQEEIKTNRLKKEKEAEISRLRRNEIKKTESIENKAEVARIISFVIIGIIALLFGSASWKGCFAFIDRPYYDSGLGEAFVDFIILIFWPIFNLVLVPASIAAPFIISSKISKHIKNTSSVVKFEKGGSEAEKILDFNYVRPIEHKQLILDEKTIKSKISELRIKLKDITSNIKNSIDVIRWTV